MNTFEILKIVGLSLQIIAGVLFLLKQVLESWKFDLDKSIEEMGKKLDRFLENRKVVLPIILLVIIIDVFLIFYFLSEIAGEPLFEIELQNLIISLIVAFVMALGLYVFPLRFIKWVSEKWRTTKKLLEGTPSRKFIVLNSYLFVISAAFSVILLAVFNLSASLIIKFIVGLFFNAFGAVALLSLSIAVIFLILRSILNIFRPKTLWMTLLIMWLAGGICLLISTFCI